MTVYKSLNKIMFILLLLIDKQDASRNQLLLVYKLFQGTVTIKIENCNMSISDFHKKVSSFLIFFTKWKHELF